MPSVICAVVHPSRIVREGLASILANSPFAPACVASSIEDVPSPITCAGEQLLVLIGVREGSDLVDDMGATKASFPDAHVVVLGDGANRDLVMTALASGATTFLEESVATPSLVKELELITQGEAVISVSVVKGLLRNSSAAPFDKAIVAPAVDEPEGHETRCEPEHSFKLSGCKVVVAPGIEQLEPQETRGEPEDSSQLSGREAAILNNLVQGASNKVIANQLKITEATVKVHVKAILRKIRVKNRTQAAIWAMRRQALSKGSGNGGLPRTRPGVPQGPPMRSN
jgi:two-component system, NarL family, nitrate/nitrite response regulator NarL